MQFEMLGRVGPGTYYMGCDAPLGRGTCGSVRKALYSTGFWGWMKGRAVRKTGGPVLTLYTSYDVFFHRELPCGGVAMIAPALNFSVALIF